MAVVGDNSQASTAYDFRFHDPGKWSNPMDLLQDVGGQLGPAYNTMAKYGLYSPDEINKISLNNDQYMLMKRRLMARAMKGRLARTLGARAGGASETMFANQVLAPEYANAAERRSSLLEKSIGQGRQMGVSGMQDLMSLYAGYMKQGEGNDTGWMDFLGPAASIASSIL
ncbi:MAG: hypothetical protein WC356_04240 [Candidatus Micrarchaeia archaeon]|jgi:hypothetical protein